MRLKGYYKKRKTTTAFNNALKNLISTNKFQNFFKKQLPRKNKSIRD